MSFVLISPDQIVEVHDLILGERELQGLAADKSLSSAIGRVENRLHFGLINDVYELAAAYATAISQAHCFNDGKKRTAFQVMDLVLDLNGVHIAWNVEEIGDQIVLLAQSKLDEARFADWLRNL